MQLASGLFSYNFQNVDLPNPLMVRDPRFSAGAISELRLGNSVGAEDCIGVRNKFAAIFILKTNRKELHPVSIVRFLQYHLSQNIGHRIFVVHKRFPKAIDQKWRTEQQKHKQSPT